MQKSLHSERNRLFVCLLRILRICASIAQVQLADALGVRQADISKVECGVRRFDVVERRAWLATHDTSLLDSAAELDDKLGAMAMRDPAGPRRRMPARKR